jgi:hypothetical protein
VILYLLTMLDYSILLTFIIATVSTGGKNDINGVQLLWRLLKESIAFKLDETGVARFLVCEFYYSFILG